MRLGYLGLMALWLGNGCRIRYSLECHRNRGLVCKKFNERSTNGLTV